MPSLLTFIFTGFRYPRTVIFTSQMMRGITFYTALSDLGQSKRWKSPPGFVKSFLLQILLTWFFRTVGHYFTLPLLEPTPNVAGLLLLSHVLAFFEEQWIANSLEMQSHSQKWKFGVCLKLYLTIQLYTLSHNYQTIFRFRSCGFTHCVVHFFILAATNAARWRGFHLQF